MGENVGYSALDKMRQVAAVCGLIAVTGAVLLYGMYGYTKTKTVEAALHQLAGVAHDRELEILNFVDDQSAKVTELANSAEVRDAIEQFSAAEKPTEESINKQKDFFAHYQKMYGYKDLFLISPTAEIIFSLNSPKALGLHLNEQQYQATSLAQSFNRAIMTVTVDVSDFDFFEPLDQAALFLCTPIFKNKKLVGVLAVQINDQIMTMVTTNYKDLGRTGELLLAIKKGSNLQLVFPTRNEQASALTSIFSFQQKEAFALQKAVMGGRGDGIGIDYRGHRAVSVWRYLPDVAWGLVAQIDLAEVIAPAFLYYRLAYGTAVVASLLLLLFFFLLLRAAIGELWYEPRVRRNMVLGALLSNLCIIGGLFYSYKNLQTTTEKKMQREAQNKVEQAKQNIMNKLEKVEAVAQTIADDVGSGRLKKEDLKIRLMRDLQEYPELVGLTIAYEPFVYDAKTKLFAPSVVRGAKGPEYQTLESFYDYTQPERPGQSITRWYSVPILQGAQWLEPYLEPISNTLAAVYSVPFFDAGDLQKKKPLGIVTVMYPLEKIKGVVEDLGIGKTGYGFIISRAGYFLYHPVVEYVQKQKTVFEIADSLNNTTLRSVGEKAVRGEKGFARYHNEITAQSSSVYYEPLPDTGWSLGITFIQEEVPVNVLAWRHHQIWILIAIITFLLLLGLLLTGAYAGMNVWGYSAWATAVFALAVFALWALVYRAASAERVQGVAVVDKVGLNKFLDGINRKAATSHESLPHTIPTGIFIRSLNFVGPMQVEFTADVWQQYDDVKDVGVAREISFPQAVKITAQEQYREKKGTLETIGWTVQGVLSQRFDYSRYPFDTKNVEIVLDHKDRMKNLMLVPDFESYLLLNPVTKPGIDEQVKILGFSVRKTIFSFYGEKPKVDFGVAETQASKTNLNFNVILRRNLIDAMVVFLLPLLVTLVSLFAIAWLTLENPPTTAYRPLSVYVAVTFALVILHRAFRDKLPSGDVVYFEYFFFFTYITIVVLIANMVLQYSNVLLQDTAKKVAWWIRFLYWPVEVLAWLITTILIFYN